MAKTNEVPEFGMLAGLKVLSTGSVTAEPFAATLMAEHGANVIHVENAHMPEATRGLDIMWAQDARNRRSMGLDIPSEEGRAVFIRLLQWADIWMESSKGGTYSRWGFPDEVVQQINPKLVIVHVSGYGQTGEEAYVRRASYNPIAQAFSGYMFMNGEPEPHPPLCMHPGTSDYITALFAAWAALAGYLKVLRTGEGDVIDLAQYEAMLRISGYFPGTYFTKGRQLTRSGNGDATVAGFDAYKCRDGQYVYIAMNAGSSVQRGLRLLGLENDPDFAGEPRMILVGTPMADKLEAALRDYCRQRTAHEVDEAMNAAGIACSEVMTYEQLGSNPQVRARENIVQWHDEASDQDVTGVNVLPRVKHSPGRIWRGAVKFGSDNDAILESLGYSAEEIARLYQSGAIAKTV